MNTSDTAQTICACDFGIAPGSQPVRRLSEATRQMAARAMSGEHGRGMKEAEFALPDAFFVHVPTPNRIAAEAVRRIGEQAPLRILAGERLAGAATLKEAAEHRIPLTDFSSVSHTTIGFEKALRIGYSGLREQIRERLTRPRHSGWP